MNIFRYLRSSFSARLSLWVTGFVTAIFVVALTLLFHYSQAVVKDESLKQNQQVLEHAALRVDRILHQAEVTAQIPYGQCFLQGLSGLYRLENGGYRQLQVYGRNIYHYYCPFKNTDWGMAMLCPERDIMADYNRLQITGFIVMAVVLLLLLLLCRIVIDRNLKPLDLLSAKVRRISQNHFDEPIPINNRQDEIGELQRSFSTMQQSLASHLNEMHQKTSALQERNQALQTAYERGRDDERTTKIKQK